MLFDSILPTVELLSKLESAFSNHAAALSIKFRQYSKYLLSFQQQHSQYLHQQ